MPSPWFQFRWPRSRADTVARYEVAQELERLNRETESDFLRIGGKLQEFQQASTELVCLMREAAELCSGGTAERSNAALSEVLQRVEAMRAQAAEVSAGLEAVRAEADHVRASFAGYERTVASFRLLGTLIRIETARLGGHSSEFGYMAEEVRKLAESIQARVDEGIEQAVNLHRQIGSALESALALETREVGQLPAVVDRVTGGMAELKRRSEEAMHASARLAAQCQAVSDAISGMVTAVQVHDITRQRVEHVMEALREAGADGAVCGLQEAQLAGAEDSFRGSAASIRDRLEDVATRIGEIAGEGRRLLARGDGTQEPIFEELEASFRSILGALRESAGCARGAAAIAGDLLRLTAATSLVADGIRAIDLQMHRLALNAGIRADHIGTAGDALSALAGGLQELALSSNGQSEQLGAVLTAMEVAAGRLEAAAVRASTMDEKVFEELRVSIQQMHDAAERARGCGNESAALAEHLSVAIAAERQAFTVDRVFSETVSRCRARLQAAAGATGAVRTDLEACSARYTMHAERDVHAAWDAAGVRPAVVETGSGGSDLGDNVEMF